MPRLPLNLEACKRMWQEHRLPISLPVGRGGAAGGMSLLRSKLVPTVVAALLLAFLFCAFVDGMLAFRTLRVQYDLATALSKRPKSPFSATEKRSQPVEMKFSAFQAVEENPENAKADNGEAKPIDDFTLVGTLPGVAAWIEVDKTTSLVMHRQDFHGYELEIIEPGQVLFTRDGEYFPLFLVFLPEPAKAAQPQAAADQGGDLSAAVTKAAFNGGDGAITRELLNSLLENPFTEISKIRLVPSPEGGMQIRAMQDSSMLAKLGMEKNDVLVGINDIPITDVGQIMNALNSMLTGARLDFQVKRGEEAGNLRYKVQ